MAFQINRGGTIYWTLENFQRFFHEIATNGSDLGMAFKNTFITFVIQQIMFLVSFMVSYFLYKKIFAPDNCIKYNFAEQICNRFYTISGLLLRVFSVLYPNGYILTQEIQVRKTHWHP